MYRDPSLALRMTAGGGKECDLAPSKGRSCPIGLRIGLCGAKAPPKGGSGSSSCRTGDTKGNPVTLTIKLIASGDTTPFEPARWKRAEHSEPYEPEPRSGHHNPRPVGPSNLRTFGPKAHQPSPLKGKRLTMICASLCSFKSCSLCTPEACPQNPRPQRNRKKGHL